MYMILLGKWFSEMPALSSHIIINIV